ncbi:MAG: hypothetical protein ABL921_25810 [Pirellula sp.]
MSNPYEATTSSQADFVSRRAAPFVTGARNGFLWSLLFALPASFIFYDKFTLAMANPLDPVTLARTQNPLTALHRLEACIQAITTATLYIVLPWAGVAGLVKLAHSKLPSQTIAEPSDADEGLERAFLTCVESAPRPR